VPRAWEEARLDRKDVLDVLAESPIGPVVRAKRANVEAARHPPSFKLRHATKDLRLVDEAAGAGLTLPAARTAHEWLEEPTAPAISTSPPSSP
jgi:3-hydroxyisobutyrate dehydrogenase-like beta-hydroxyacid dehydrogenase